jgi:type I restriction enzyme, S subunit
MKQVPLGELMADAVGSVDPARFPEEIFELWSIPAFDKGCPEIVEGSSVGSTKKLVRPNDVLLSRIVPHIRRSWVVTPNASGRRQVASGEWIIFRGGEVVPEYLRHVLVSDAFHAQFMQTVAGVGGSLLRARSEGVRAIKIPLPPLAKQRRIAAILDQADELRRKRHSTLERIRGLPGAVFVEMFGDPATNAKGWPLGRIGDLAASTQYGTSSKASDTGEYPILRMGNILRSGEWDLRDLKYIDLRAEDVAKYTVRSGDVLFNRTNSRDLVGKTAVFRESVAFAYAGYLVRLRVNERAVPEYISSYLNSQAGKRILRGRCKAIIGMANINAEELKSIPIPIPPFSLQRSFQAKLLQLQPLVSLYHRHLARLEALFAALQHRAFRGELTPKSAEHELEMAS